MARLKAILHASSIILEGLSKFKLSLNWILTDSSPMAVDGRSMTGAVKPAEGAENDLVRLFLYSYKSKKEISDLKYE